MIAVSLNRRRLGAALATAMIASAIAPAAADQTPAKQLFGAEALPSAAPAPQTFGSYAHGCIAGAVAMPKDGPHWQVMRGSRNRSWGHPAMVSFLKRLSVAAAERDGWPGLLLGDIAQPRGGPMASGHASHQVGLDADIYLTPMPNRRLTDQERETMQPVSMLKAGTFTVDDRIWTPQHLKLIREAALDGQVQRIFVNPGIKKKLCETASGDRAWLNKVRPMYGHDYHFHVRIVCQAGSPGCEPQESTGTGDGCGDLGWWFNVALRPPKPGAKPPRPRPPMTMAALPKACAAVLDAPNARSAARNGAAPAMASQPSRAIVAPPEFDDATTSYAPVPRAEVPLAGGRPRS